MVGRIQKKLNESPVLEAMVARKSSVQRCLHKISTIDISDINLNELMQALERDILNFDKDKGLVLDLPETNIKLCVGNRQPHNGEKEYYDSIIKVIKQYAPEEFERLEQIVSYIHSLGNDNGRGGVYYFNGVILNPTQCQGSIDASKTVVHEGAHLEMENMFPDWSEFSLQDSYTQTNITPLQRCSFLTNFAQHYEGLKPLTMTREIYAILVDIRYRLKLINGIADNVTIGQSLTREDVKQLDIIDPIDQLVGVTSLLGALEQDDGMRQLTEDGQELVRKMRLAERSLVELRH